MIRKDCTKCHVTWALIQAPPFSSLYAEASISKPLLTQISTEKHSISPVIILQWLWVIWMALCRLLSQHHLICGKLYIFDEVQSHLYSPFSYSISNLFQKVSKWVRTWKSEENGGNGVTRKLSSSFSFHSWTKVRIMEHKERVRVQVLQSLN